MYFIHQEVIITENKIIREDPLTEITKTLKSKNYNKKQTHLKLKAKFQGAFFVNRNFFGKKFSRCCRKT